MERYSMSEFTPLTMAEKKLNIDHEIGDLTLQRSPLVVRKQEIELELSSYNKRVKGRQLPPDEYNEICQWQKALSQEKVDIERKLLDIKNKMVELNRNRDRVTLNIKRLPDSNTKQTLIGLRDKYMAFASDTTRVSSMRAMASKFIEEIQDVIKSLSNETH